MATIEFPVEGMTCEHCVQSVKGALEKVPGVRAANVNLRERRARVEVDLSSVSVVTNSLLLRREADLT